MPRCDACSGYGGPHECTMPRQPVTEADQIAIFTEMELLPAADASLELLLEEWDVYREDGYLTVVKRAPAPFTPAWLRRAQAGQGVAKELAP
jgi:hypothetical protein